MTHVSRKASSVTENELEHFALERFKARERTQHERILEVDWDSLARNIVMPY
jgi:hypothetical protein